MSGFLSRLSSRHRWGLACDPYLIDHLTQELVWDGAFWDVLYRAVPPKAFGLKDILPKEYAHLEAVCADEMIARAAEFGLTQS